METVKILVSILVIYCHFSCLFSDAKQTGTSRITCSEGYFKLIRQQKCVPCVVVCTLGEEVCRQHGCLEYMKKQCTPDECYEASTGKCRHKTRQIAKCPPPAPLHFEEFTSFALEVKVDWPMASDDKSEQKFHVKYKKCADKWDFASKVHQSKITYHGLRKKVHYKVTNLESDVCYEFRVLSKDAPSVSHTSDLSNDEASGTTQVEADRADSNEESIADEDESYRHDADDSHVEQNTGYVLNYKVIKVVSGVVALLVSIKVLTRWRRI